MMVDSERKLRKEHDCTTLQNEMYGHQYVRQSKMQSIKLEYSELMLLSGLLAIDNILENYEACNNI